MPKKVDTSDLEQLENQLLELLKRSLQDDVPVDVHTAISDAHTKLIVALAKIEEDSERKWFNRKK